ncbi:unnamed protein product, partial [Scytosiphon promiscuus]
QQQHADTQQWYQEHSPEQPPASPPHPQQQQLPQHLAAEPPPLLLVEGVPISEADITATNGVVHRLSSAVMAAPANVAEVLMNPPFPLSAATDVAVREAAGRGGVGCDGRVGEGKSGGGAGNGFEALGELVRLAWPLVNKTLTEEGPLTVLAPTDAAFDMAIAAGALPPRPWYNDSSSSSPPSSSTTAASASASPVLTAERAARVLLSHTLRAPEGQGPLLFSPTAGDPFASGFTNGDRLVTAAVVVADAAEGFPFHAAGLYSDGERGRSGDGDGGDADDGTRGRGSKEALAGGAGSVDVGVRVLEVGTRSAVAGTTDGVADREVYVDGARVVQCVDGTGVGHDCGSNPRPSNTYALNGAHLCVVHAVDRVMFPADPATDLAAILDGTPSLSRFAALLREHGFSPFSSPRSPSSASSSSSPSGGNANGGASRGGG